MLGCRHAGVDMGNVWVLGRSVGITQLLITVADTNHNTNPTKPNPKLANPSLSTSAHFQSHIYSFTHLHPCWPSFYQMPLIDDCGKFGGLLA